MKHYESSRWREWCVSRNHPGSTFNPLLNRTSCACGEVTADGDTATHELCEHLAEIGQQGWGCATVTAPAAAGQMELAI